MESTRPLDRLDKYLVSLCKKHNENYVHTKNSSYYDFNGRVIRVSDHIGKNSSGSIHFIVTDNNYLLYYNGTQKIRVMDYESVKDFCRSFIFLSPMLSDLCNNTTQFEIEKEKTNSNDANMIKGLNQKVNALKNEKKNLENSLSLRKEELSNQKKMNQEQLKYKDEAIVSLKKTIKALTEENDGDFNTFITLLHKYGQPRHVSMIMNHLYDENNEVEPKNVV
jgi:hypothetical protein